jgi:benzoate membrane transport protein
VIAGLGLPLFVVTMAGQNVPGFAVLQTFGYRAAPRPVLVSSGIASGASAFFGGHAVNLAAITAAIMAGPEAHADRGRRWIATFSSGICYLLLGLGAGLAAAVVRASPSIIIIAVAGLALIGAFVQAVTTALAVPQHRVAAGATLLVTASGVVVAGIGSAFWGLLVGGVLMLWLRPKPAAPTSSPGDAAAPTPSPGDAAGPTHSLPSADD